MRSGHRMKRWATEVAIEQVQVNRGIVLWHVWNMWTECMADPPLYSFLHGSQRRSCCDCGRWSWLYSFKTNRYNVRVTARAAQVPVLVSSGQRLEAKEFMKFAYEISENFDRPVIFRTTTRLKVSAGLVELCIGVEPEDKPYESIRKNTGCLAM